MSEHPNAPNPADFSRNERPNEYEAIFRVSGTVRIAIKADSIEDAKEQARKMQEDEESPNFTELDEVDEIRIDWVRKESPMYRVIRDGETMQVSHLDAGDIPREPDERGF